MRTFSKLGRTHVNRLTNSAYVSGTYILKSFCQKNIGFYGKVTHQLDRFFLFYKIISKTFPPKGRVRSCRNLITQCMYNLNEFVKITFFSQIGIYKYG